MKKVLVIDDNPTIVELIKYAVNLQGSYHVVVAYDGVQGLERVYAERPDCVIIDVKMPRMDGYALVEQALTHNSELKVLMMTGYPGDRLPATILKAREIRTLAKPFDMDRMCDRVVDMLARP